ncbi:MAG: glycosyltransferase [Candidatus Eisenbacteria bacterium]|nr:glycosyltransferase [Candidatus Eisenbacteria bacterium]
MSGADASMVPADRRLRVLVVTNLYPGGVVPGRGAFVQNQVESLRALGHRIEVVAIDGARSKLEYLRGIGRLRHALERERFDLVHAHYGLTGLVARVQSRAPLVVTFLGSDVLWSRQRPLSRLAARLADLSIVMSEEMRRLLGVSGCRVIPNGTSLGRFRPVDPAEARAAMGWGADAFIVLWPWNPARPEKNFALAESAVATLGGRARLVSFHGESQDRYNLALNAADVALLTSHWEGSSNTVREAMAVGLPVVAVPAGDAPEMLAGVQHCSVVRRDPGSIAAALAGLLAVGGGGARRVRYAPPAKLASYTLEATARAIDREYHALLTSRHRPSEAVAID